MFEDSPTLFGDYEHGSVMPLTINIAIQPGTLVLAACINV
jgi:hypothetical protein